MELDLETAEKSVIHRTLTTIVAPRPIGWISSKDADGRENLAPFSYFNAVSTQPPIVMFSPVNANDGVLKHTPNNVLETGEFAVNMVTEDLLAATDLSSEEVAHNVDEFEHTSLQKEQSATVDVSRVADALAVMECTLYEEVSLPSSTVIFGSVEHISVDESICTDGKIDTRKIDSVGRMGGPYYTGVDFLDFQRDDSR